MTCPTYDDHDFRLCESGKIWCDHAGTRWQRLDFRCEHCGEIAMEFIPIERVDTPKRPRQSRKPALVYLAHMREGAG